MGGAMLSKSLIQFSTDERGCIPSLLFDLRPNYGGGNEDRATSFKRSHTCVAPRSAPDAAAGHRQPMPPLETLGYSQASLDQSLVGSLLLSPGSWCTEGFVCALQGLFPQSCASSVIKSYWPPKTNSLWVLSPFVRSPSWEMIYGSYNFLKTVQ